MCGRFHISISGGTVEDLMHHSSSLTASTPFYFLITYRVRIALTMSTDLATDRIDFLPATSFAARIIYPTDVYPLSVFLS